MIKLLINGQELNYYVATNSRGDVEYLYRGNGTVKAHYTYDTWGNVLSVTNENGNVITDANDIGLLNPIRYRGYYYDSETGYYYLQSRYYDPEMGRFLNADSIIDNSKIIGSNLYSYCGNNPIINVDPNGHCFGTIVGAIVGGVVGGIGGAISAAVTGKSVLAGVVTGAATGAIAGAVCGLVVDTMGVGAVAIVTGAAICGVAAATGNVVNQFWNYNIEKSSATRQNDNKNKSASSKVKSNSNGKIASECSNFSEYVDYNSIIFSAITAAALTPISMGTGFTIDAAFADIGLKGINAVAYVGVTFVLNENISILQTIIELF